MTGFYPDVPSHRMALDKDGSLLLTVSGGVVTEQTNALMIALNDETTTTVGNWNNVYVIVLFPELRDLAGLFSATNHLFSSTKTMTVTTSVDTTNGLDGTWDALTSYSVVGSGTDVAPYHRTSIVTAAAAGVKAVRFLTNEASGYSNYRAVHLYGTITAGENPDRLAIWDSAFDERVAAAYLDWGDVPRSSTDDREFRVKNLSSTLTATDITCSIDALTDASPTVVGQHTLSADGIAFASTAVHTGGLAPGAISAPFTLRRTTPADADLSLWDVRLNAVAASWA